LDLSKIIRYESIGKTESAIGMLYIFRMIVGYHIELEKLGIPLTEYSPDSFARTLSMFICCREANLVEGKFKPKEQTLTKEDVEKLTEEDLENIAKIFIEGSDYLYKENVISLKEREGGGTELVSEKGGIKYPQENGESFVQYLYRLFIIDEVKRKEHLANLSPFSRGLSESIGKTLSLGESLRKTVSATNVRVTPADQLPSLDIHKIMRLDEERRLAPFKALNERLDRLIDSTIQSVDFQVETNKVQTGIASELKSSGNSNVKFSRTNIKLTMIVIVLTAFGILLPYCTNSRDKEVTNLLKDIKTNTAESNNSASSHTKEFEKKIAAQQQLIQNLQMQKEQQDKKLKILEERLIKIEKKNE
jgi:hypothetical protein